MLQQTRPLLHVTLIQPPASSTEPSLASTTDESRSASEPESTTEPSARASFVATSAVLESTVLESAVLESCAEESARLASSVATNESLEQAINKAPNKKNEEVKFMRRSYEGDAQRPLRVATRRPPLVAEDSR